MEAGADDQAPSLSGCPVTEVDTKGMCREDEEAKEKAESEEKREKEEKDLIFYTIVSFFYTGIQQKKELFFFFQTSK